MTGSRTRRARNRETTTLVARTAGHSREIIAIILVAVAVFLAFVLYLGWDGGSVGTWLGDGARWLIGLLAYVVPLLFALIAYTILVPLDKRPRRGIIAGALLLALAFMIAAAADSFGIFAGERPARLFVDSYLMNHGGAAGDLLWGLLVGSIGRLGVNVLVVVLLLVGTLLLTGSSLQQWAARSRRQMAHAKRAAHERADAVGEWRRERKTSVDDEEPPTKVLGDENPTALLGDRRDGGPEAETVVVSDDETRVLERHALVDGAVEMPDIFAYIAGDETAKTPQAAAVAVDEEGEVVEAVADEAPIEAAAAPEAAKPASGPVTAEQLSLAAAGDGEAAAAMAKAFGEGEKHRPWILPNPALLERLGEGQGETPENIASVSQRLVETLGHFGVQAQIIGTVSGPRVTRYELQLAPGIKVSRVAGLKDDIAYALAATDVRVQAPIPGKTAVGVEVPNIRANYVTLGDIHGTFPAQASPMSFWLGKDVTGKAVFADLVKMVHLLVAGTTGSGKSGCLNALISSIMLRATPDEVRMIMIDPKKVELSNFDGIPHLLAPVVTNMKQATYVLDNICREMDRRYDVLSRHGCQDVRALNKKLAREDEDTMPYIVVVIDELADLMMVAPSEVEGSIIRLGQLGRSCGIHLVVATQRPSVDVVTGMIKTNIPSRIAFAVSSQTDSRIILDQGGAESLLGMGDMLFSPMGSNRLLRVQGALITAREMRLITEHWKRQAKPDFQPELLENPAAAPEKGGALPGADELLGEAIKTVVLTGAASVALLQRRLRVGYARAGRLIDIMEELGIISGYDGSKARAVLISEDELAPTLARLAGEAPADEESPAAPVAIADNAEMAVDPLLDVSEDDDVLPGGDDFDLRENGSSVLDASAETGAGDAAEGPSSPAVD